MPSYHSELLLNQRQQKWWWQQPKIWKICKFQQDHWHHRTRVPRLPSFPYGWLGCLQSFNCIQPQPALRPALKAGPMRKST